MKKLKGDEEKSDGLEITSVGSLYAGLWDKKYWSSSRVLFLFVFFFFFFFSFFVGLFVVLDMWKFMLFEWF